MDTHHLTLKPGDSAAVDPTEHHTSSTVRSVVSNIKNHGKMKDVPRLSLWTAEVELPGMSAGVAVSLAISGGRVPMAEEFASALLADIIDEFAPPALRAAESAV